MGIINSEKIELATWHRNQVLKLAFLALKKYAETENIQYLEYAQWFMAQSKSLRKDISKL